jgi:hypothetical protein
LDHLVRCTRPALAALVLVLLSGAPSRAVTVGVAPADTTVNLADEFALRITTSDFADLKGFDLLFSFDPASLEFLGAEAGDVLTGPGRLFTDYALVAHGAGADTVLYDAAMLDGATAGPGTLVSFHFRALAVGVAAVNCQRADFRDPDNAATLPDCWGALIRVETATPARATSWGRIKTLYR